ncbi:hypothetical protein L3X38_029399 [Prunus dulcis]|uniref:Uncharacterized protein n=1 Tax=Prunus dulcis TaxID=3755 RepID=A0AAD4VUC1_PRUDU|nr:hypothetical protein L3X38_029399 [Prunus dulcis]
MAAAVELTSGQDHTLTMASRHDTSKIKKSLRKVSEMEKSLGELGEIWEMENSHGEPGKMSEMEKSLATLLSHQIQLVHLKKLIWDELRFSRAGSLKHGAVHPYPSLPMEGMTVNQGGQDRSMFLMVTFDGGKYTSAIYEVKFKFGGEVDDMGGAGAPKPVATFSDFNVGVQRFFTAPNYMAVVVDKTIYALNMFKVDEIIAYSLKRKVNDDGDIAYSLLQLYKLNSLEIPDPPLQFGEFVTDYLVHLGNQDLVHVKTSTNEEYIEAGNWFMLTFGFTP